jgi:Cu/Ag efflux protein CusF
MRKLTMAIAAGGMLFIQTPGAWADSAMVARGPAGGGEKTGSSESTMPAKGVLGAVRVRGTIAAIDREHGTVTLKGPAGRTVTIEVRDKQKLDAIKAGDPVVAVYTEAVVIQVNKAGTAAPGVTTRETRVTSKPGETPAGAMGREISITGTITAIDRKTHTVTIKGPQGRTETIAAKDPKDLEAVKVGDMVEITYTQALAVSLDKPEK